MRIFIESEHDKKEEDSIMIGMPSPEIIPREKALRVGIIAANNQPCYKENKCIENQRITILKNGCKIDLPWDYITTGK